MSIKTNYMQKIKYVLATAFFAFALAFIAMPTATYASYGDETGDTGYDYTSGGSSWGNDYSSTEYTSPSSNWGYDYSSSAYDYTSPGSSWGNDYSSTEYTSPSSNWGYDYSSTAYEAPSYSTGCSSCGGSVAYSSTPSYNYGCSNCGTSTGYSSTPSYKYGCTNCGGSTGSSYGCTNCGTTSHPAPAQGCTNCGGSSPAYSYAPSTSVANSSSNPTNTNVNTNGPSNSNATSSSTSSATGGNALVTNNPTNTNTNSASTSVSVALINNSPSTSTATNNSTTTVNVINNIVVNVPPSGYVGPYVPPTTNNNDLIVTCSINPSYNVQIGQDVSFFANASGGNGNYSYSWTGSDGLNSSSQSFTGRFYSAGSKYATVTVYSNGQSRSQTCNTNVGGSYNGNLSAYCTATPPNANTNQYITWTVYPTGGNGNYYYSWTGSDGLYGNNSSITQSYGSTGLKTANVTVTSNGQSVTANCSANVNAIYGYQTQASNVTLIKGTSDQIAPASGIYLGQLPATGISLSWKVVLFAIGLLAWSIFAAFVVSKRKKVSGVNTNTIADFKAKMLAMKNR